MLVLTRKQGEDVVINNDITVTVVSIEGGRVRLGITAPRDVPVDRGEVHKRKVEFEDATLNLSVTTSLSDLLTKPRFKLRETMPLKSR
jgi:carbon storage regulator